MKFHHQYDKNGHHRLGVSYKKRGNLTQDADIKWGKWYGYTQIAIYPMSPGHCYAAVTDYHTDTHPFNDRDKVYTVNTLEYNLEEVLPKL